MPLIPNIEIDDITIAEKHTSGFNLERCEIGLWSIYNVIKKIANNACPRQVTECLLMIGANAKFENNGMMSLVYSGKTSKKYKRGMPGAQYLFELENFGFVFYNIDTLEEGTPNKRKLSVKNIKQFYVSYNLGDFRDVIFGLKLFSDICIKQSSPLSCFLAGDIRVAFEDAPKLYAPPADELFYPLPNEQKKAAFVIHDKLVAMGCVRELEGEHAVKYKHKGQMIATIWAGERIWFLPEIEQKQKLVFKFNLCNIGQYTAYLDECTEEIRKSIVGVDNCGHNKKNERCANGQKNCDGVIFEYQGKKYKKCTRYFCIFKDLSEQAIFNYVMLITLENEHRI